VTYELTFADICDSVTEARVNALAGLGFTERQRRFLVTVMVHSGCFLERQYCAFTGTVRGQNSRELMARLVARGFVRIIEPGPVRRGRLYHVHHKPLYEAIGQADKAPRVVRYQPTVLNEKQAQAFLKSAAKHRLGAVFSVALAMACDSGRHSVFAGQTWTLRMERSQFNRPSSASKANWHSWSRRARRAVGLCLFPR
jgi:hypothetical protein